MGKSHPSPPGPRASRKGARAKRGAGRCNTDVINWLLEPDSPPVRYLTLIGLLGKTGRDAEVSAVRRAVAEYGPVRRSIFRETGHGIVFHGCKDCTVEENDIGWCLVDGVIAAGGIRNLTIRRNFIHDNFRYGHPDNIQFWDDIDGVVIEDNVLFDGGQSIMSGNLKNTRVVNNLVIGTHAASLILGGESGGPVYNLGGLKPEERTARLKAFETCAPDKIEVVHNTVCATALSPTNWGGTGFTVRDNVIAPLHPCALYQINSLCTAKVDYNLLWAGPDYKGALATIYAITGSGGADQEVLDLKTDWSATTPALLQDKFGLEKHGVVADPQFTNAPKYYTVSHYGYISSGTRAKLILWGQVGKGIAVGDYVEIAFDGVPRKVTEVGEFVGGDKKTNSTITFEPPLKDLPDFPVSVANWGDKTDLTWNLKLRETSPGHNSASDGKDMGSSLNLANYVKGDFDGDGKRDLPELPRE